MQKRNHIFLLTVSKLAVTLKRKVTDENTFIMFQHREEYNAC